MINLPANPTLQDLQQYVRKIEEERGFVDESVIDKCLLLGDEVGELFRAVRALSGIGVDPDRPIQNVAEELADVLQFVVAIANRYDVNLEEALREKEERNARRQWNRLEET
ncbi:MAG TPA: MazG nucleotide pyrophosphohydrolase domain-containing protein [Gammaproteobacteria bacterium]